MQKFSNVKDMVEIIKQYKEDDNLSIFYITNDIVDAKNTIIRRLRKANLKLEFASHGNIMIKKGNATIGIYVQNQKNKK